MKNSILLGSVACLGAIALAITASQSQATIGEDAFAAHPVNDPAFAEVLATADVQLVHAAPFELVEPATHYWRTDQPTYTKGLLLVVQVDPTLAQPRQTLEPVLYVGGQTAERVNFGYPSGQLVLIVPNMDLEGLASAPMFFGTPALPEQVTPEVIAAELGRTLANGTPPPSAERISLATAEPLTVLDMGDLYFEASHLIEKYSSSETDLIRGLRVGR
jgi:hypothetical protein